MPLVEPAVVKQFGNIRKIKSNDSFFPSAIMCSTATSAACPPRGCLELQRGEGMSLSGGGRRGDGQINLPDQGTLISAVVLQVLKSFGMLFLGRAIKIAERWGGGGNYSLSLPLRLSSSSTLVSVQSWIPHPMHHWWFWWGNIEISQCLEVVGEARPK